MHNCNMPSKVGVIFLFSMFVACSPLKEKLLPKSVVEMDFIDPDLVLQSSDAPDHMISGNLSLEVQQDLSTGKSNIYVSASFHEPIEKNVLFEKVRTNVLSKNVYKPKPVPPVDQPCGIPGFPDCANPGTPPATNNPITPPNPKPDDPCGIPGFPDCPTNQ